MQHLKHAAAWAALILGLLGLAWCAAGPDAGPRFEAPAVAR